MVLHTILLINHNYLGGLHCTSVGKLAAIKITTSVCQSALEALGVLKGVFQWADTCIFPQRHKKAPAKAQLCPRPHTGRRVLQELFDLCWGKLCSGHGEADPQLLQR